MIELSDERMKKLLAEPFHTNEILALQATDMKEAHLLCKVERKRASQEGLRIQVFVINGGWTVSFSAFTGLGSKVHSPGLRRDYKLAWRGKLPEGMLHTNAEGRPERYVGYNDCLLWINEQIAAGATS